MLALPGIASDLARQGIPEAVSRRVIAALQVGHPASRPAVSRLASAQTADAPSSPPMMQLLGGGELPADVMFLEQMLDQEEPGTPSLISSFDTHVGGRGGTARVGSPHTTFGSSFDTQVGGRGGRASPAPFDAQVGSPAAATAFGSSSFD